MSFIFDILKKHEGHDITCMHKSCDYVIICKTCKKDIMVFGEPAIDKCFKIEDEDYYDKDLYNDNAYATEDFNDIGIDEDNDNPVCKDLHNCPYSEIEDCMGCPEGIGIGI